MRRILILGAFAIGMASITALAEANDVKLVTLEDNLVKKDFSLNTSETLLDFDLRLNQNVLVGALMNGSSFTPDLGTADDRGFTGFDLIMDSREKPRIRDDVVHS